MGKYLLLLFFVLLSGCAIQTPPLEQKEAPQSLQAQKAAQQAVKDQAPSTPTLKRKIALGRITNETVYGRSLLRDEYNDPLGKQVTDMMSKVLTESGAYLVFERPDIARVKNDVAMSGGKINIIGVDTLIVGSLTELVERLLVNLDLYLKVSDRLLLLKLILDWSILKMAKSILLPLVLVKHPLKQLLRLDLVLRRTTTAP